MSETFHYGKEIFKHLTSTNFMMGNHHDKISSVRTLTLNDPFLQAMNTRPYRGPAATRERGVMKSKLSLTETGLTHSQI